MGRALNLVTGRVTNAGATITALTADTGDSFSVRAFTASTPAYLEEIWAWVRRGGVARIRSPRLHDQSQGIRLQVPADEPQPLIPFPAVQPLQVQDLLTVELSGSEAATDVLSYLVYYEDLPGTDANLMTWAEVKPRIKSIVGVEVDFTTGRTLGDYGGGKALNANFDNLKRNVNYALLGIEPGSKAHSINLFGPDTGNLRVGVPGSLRTDISSEWFVRLSEKYGTPHIPIINAANVAATTCDIVHIEAERSVNATYVFAELG